MTVIDAPLITDTVIGVRAWDVSSTTHWELLQGYERTAWATEGEFTEAICKAGIPDDGAHEQKAPWRDCSCGLYAAHPFREAAFHHHLRYVFQEKLDASGFPGCHHNPRARKVYGVIEATGYVEVHQHGFRAEFARPIGFLLPGADPHRYHVLDLCRRYRACRIDSLLGETLESFVARRTSGALTERSVAALLEPVLKARDNPSIADRLPGW